MKYFILAAVGLALMAPFAHAAGKPKSALDGYQFDGVSADAELKVEGHTRRGWLRDHPVQAKEYWAAWDCKDEACDSKWYANIRKKAALIKRTPDDPKVQQAPASASR